MEFEDMRRETTGKVARWKGMQEESIKLAYKRKNENIFKYCVSNQTQRRGKNKKKTVQ